MLGNAAREFGSASYSDATLDPVGTARVGEPIRLRLLPRSDASSRSETWRIWLDLDGNGNFDDEELIQETASVGAHDVELALTEPQQAALHGVEPRTVTARVAKSSDGQTMDVSLVAEGRELAVRPILLGSGTITVADASIEVSPGRHHLVQFRELPTDDDKQALAAQGIALLGYLPERTYWARVSASAADVARIETAGGVVLAKPATAAIKTADELVAGEANGSEPIAVHFFSDATAAEIAEAKASVGAVGSGAFATATVPRALISKLANLEAVQWVEPSRTTPTTHSSAGNADHDVTPLREAPYGLDGAGIPVAVFDAGWVDWDHPDLAGRVFHDPSLTSWRPGQPIGDVTEKQSHATHMAGIIAGSGVGNAAATGTAPAATIYSYRESYSYLDINQVVVSQSKLYGWRLINHSYGNGWPCADPWLEPCKSSPSWDSYIQDARNADAWAYENGVLSVFSAGNNGLLKNEETGWESDNWSTTYSGAVGKNVIATCAASQSNYIERFSIKLDSSKGPSSDGRIKPDLCAEGAGASANGPAWTTELGGGYATTAATSPAAAQVTGIVALLQQAYRDLRGRDANLPPALAKGLLIHTATDMVEDNSFRWLNQMWASNATPGPDYTTGWGFPDARAAVDVLQAPSLIGTGSIAPGLVQEFDVKVPANAALKVTLIWTDPPAAVGAARALVNDLDLRVTNLATAELFYPWVLDKAAPMKAAKRGVNKVDNVEQITLHNDKSSEQTYRINVKGTTVPLGPQQFFLLSSAPLAPVTVVVYASKSTYNGNLGGRPGADAKCLAELPTACGKKSKVHAVISISTKDEMRDMQRLYGISMAAPVVGPNGRKLKESWEALWGHSIENSLEAANSLSPGWTYWSGSEVAGATFDAATPGSQYMCSNFTSGTSGFRAPHGASNLTTPAEQFALGWDGGNEYPSCSSTEHLLCVCY